MKYVLDSAVALKWVLPRTGEKEKAGVLLKGVFPPTNISRGNVP